jgi:L-aspartate oxidase
VRRLAWRELGLVRHGAGLAAARERLAGLWRSLPAGAGETRNLVAAASLVAAAAERREESRGAHFRTDFPRSDERWRRRQTLTAEVGERELAIRFDAPREAVPA